MSGTTKQTSKTEEMATASLLIAVCVASRALFPFLPNIKPVTPIIMLTVQLMGLRSGLFVATGTVLISGALLGLGPWIPFQLLAWYTIAGISHLISKAPLLNTTKSSTLVCGAFGVLFGAIVSLEKILYGGPLVYIAYWTTGIPFDVLHAVGNIALYPHM